MARKRPPLGRVYVIVGAAVKILTLYVWYLRRRHLLPDAYRSSTKHQPCSSLARGDIRTDCDRSDHPLLRKAHDLHDAVAVELGRVSSVRHDRGIDFPPLTLISGILAYSRVPLTNHEMGRRDEQLICSLRGEPDGRKVVNLTARLYRRPSCA